ncbi:MAG TPA: guanylate kinase [Legionellales bacterium]|nr:guanylate kinase [Legionellales bacterium]|tara:strand:+ start:1510 stop:2133 length:624 start_codon:yes stop_codon:yes gene_type:complete
MAGEQTLGNLFIVAAPSGGGKTSLVKKLCEQLPEVAVSVSHTTRPPRPGEQDGVHYFFVDSTTFTQMIDENAFVEHAMVFGHYYGTSYAQIQTRLAKGLDVLLDIDWQGAQQIKRQFQTAAGIFVLPPSLKVLEERLSGRQQDTPAIIKKRMQRAQAEINHFKEFDYVIVNDDFTQATAELAAIITANRLQITRQRVKIANLLSLLL